ncbi:hypothetical protein BGZ70_007092 [Mortierella alpina]|uniref:Uncharacterized protein n=1 Tax=Mortierella alpina TaxID=64518 RepID=A0A9P6JAA8_MORAP|nr:hypothetical protein BGZ70_007092 [Mortierella alpina]
MDSLVSLNPHCYATDGTSIYALDLGVPQRTSSPSLFGDFYYVLVKSNPNPSPDLSDLSWSVVSVSNREGLNLLESLSACYIHPTTKTFSVLSIRSRATKGIENIIKDSVRGVQYQPNADGGGGGGRWSNITVSPGSPSFEWKSTFSDRYLNTQLYKPNDSENLMFATANPSFRNMTAVKIQAKVWIASMNPTDLIMKQNPSPWLFDLAYGTMDYMTFSDNALYFVATTNSNMTLGAVPISGDTLASTPSVVSTFDLQTYKTHCGSFTTAMTIMPLGANIRGPVFLFDGKSKTIAPVSVSTALADGPDPRAALAMPGTVPFLLSASRDNLLSLPLSGQNGGKWFSADMVAIPAAALENPTAYSESGSGSDSNTGLIVGVVCAVLVLLLAGLGFLWHRKRSAQIKNKELAHAEQ